MQQFVATPAFKSEAILGEGPVWDPVIQKLYWVDIKSNTVYLSDPANAQSKSWTLDQMVGCVINSGEHKLVCALQDKIIQLNTVTGDICKLAAIEADKPDIRSNDGKADAQGRVWVGTLHIPGDKGKACLYRVDKDLSIHLVLHGLGMSNGLGWSPDGKNMYLIDTTEKQLKSFDFSAESGTITNERVLIKFENDGGSPDGMCVDAEGMLWVALYGGKAVARFDSQNGKQLAKIDVSAANPTSCTFGGPDLDTLYITSAREGMSEEDLEKYPLSGSVFSVKPGVKGLPANNAQISCSS
jgi:sugar lactone lactonase YvrE